MDVAGSTVIKLNNDNYQLWKHQMKLLLKVKKVWCTIEMEKPEPTDTNAREIEMFEEKSVLAASILLSSLEPSQAQQVLNLDEGKKIWCKLQQIHEGKVASRRVDLRLELSNIKLKDTENIEKYLARAQYLRDQLEQCNSAINNEEYIGLLLNGLPSTFKGIRVQMKANGLEKITLEEFRSGLKAQEDELKLTEVETKLEAACVSKDSGKFHKKQKPTSNVTCWVCNKRGHYARDCYHRADRKQEKDKEKVNSASGNATNYESAMNVTPKEKPHSVKWYLDSGATSHMTYNKSIFTQISNIENTEVKMADGNFIKVIGVGTVRVKIINKNCLYEYINVSNVLLVPEITENLFSISAFEKKGFKVEFRNGICEIKRNDGVLMMTGKRINNLYEAEVERPIDKIFQEEVKLSAELWHRRYGHQNLVTLNKMKNEELVDGLEFTTKNMSKCENCVIGKAVKESFTSHQEIKTKDVLELIHMDLCGPIQEPSLAGSKYIYLLVDDYSRKLFVYFLKTKDETFSKFKIFKNEIENQTKRKIKRIRSDNGGEFTNRVFKNFLQEHGIIHEETAPYTPQENGIAERNNRTIIQMVRCMLNDAKLPIKYWAEAAYYAVYLKNRTYTRKVGMTPEEKFTGKKPDVKHLKIFGSLVYYLVDKQNRRKLDPVSNEAIFVGYNHLTKHYRVFCKERDTIITVRDAQIIENKRGSEILKNKNENYKYIEIKYNPDESELIEVQSETDEENEQEEVIEDENIIERQEHLEENNQNEKESDVSYDSEESELDDGAKNTTAVDPDYQQTTPSLEVEIFRRSKRIQSHNTNRINLMTNNIHVPEDYEEAMCSNNKNEWKKAIGEELMSHHSNKTWDIVNKPKNKQVIDSKWVFKIKENADGTINKFKARLVARGFNQVKGESYDEVFAPVIRLSTLRIVFAIATERDLDLYQMDVTTAYLNGTLQDEIYMEIPSGLDENKTEKVCKLKKGLYGLKQSARIWYATIKKELEKLEFKMIDSSPCVFLYDKNHIYMIICLYVDDILWATNSTEIAFEKMNRLNEKFEIKFIGEAKYLLGWEIARNKNKGILYLKQEKYIKRILQRFNMNECKKSSIPMQPENKKVTENVKEVITENIPYQELIGSLIYLSQGTRPDIAYVTTYLSQFNTKYTRENWVQAKHVLRYLKETMTEGITYKKNGKMLKLYSDASWNNTLDGKGFSGYISKLAGGAISWQCKKQEVVALSTCESEFMALTEAIKELIWIKRIFIDLKQEDKLGNLIIYADNQAAIKLSSNSTYHSTTKHIQRKYFFIRDEIDRYKINLKYIESKDNAADFLTKAVTKPVLQKCKQKVGLEKIGLD